MSQTISDKESSIIDVNLCAGAGGLAIGLSAAGFSPFYFYEIDSHCCSTLNYNIKSNTPTLKGTVFETDIRDVDWAHVKNEVRLLAAGSPCQPFSLGGKHMAEKDGRNMFPEVFRAIRELRPKAIIIENVRGLLRKAFYPYFNYVLRQLECPSIKPKHNELWQNHNERIRKYQCSTSYQPEYLVTWRLFDAADFGVPQNRIRVFIIATRSDYQIYKFPKRTHSKSTLLLSQRLGDYWRFHGIPQPDILPGNGILTNIENDTQRWLTIRDAVIGLSEPNNTNDPACNNHWKIPGARVYNGHKGRTLDWPSKTIKAGVHGVGGGENVVIDDDGKVRYLTLRETARLQTFPDSHYFEGARSHVTRQIGNAVPCRLAAAIAHPLYYLLETHDTK